MNNQDEIKTFYRRNLPHYQSPGNTYFVTFRLAGSLPAHVITRLKTENKNQLEQIAGISNNKMKREKYEQFKSDYFDKFDLMLAKFAESPKWLDDDEIARTVTELIHYYDGKEYDLIAYTIMPNHVHIIFRPPDVDRSEASIANTNNKLRSSASHYIVTKILQNIKSKSALKANAKLKRSGAFWQHESYDHVVRDEEELCKIIEYVLNNPVKAGLVEYRDEWKRSYCKYDL